ncbi:MAG TPA: hypothetical protein ACHBZA_01170 [Arsenophonus apicola]|uniref:hypothetical protein n=1 Tax=Arsenophonus apicola TaxID=2879119 RepID=UPI001CDD3586|nr:hypothetical protein [Arsenophonus apicola]UBX30735.1 hypothetical protein LDL57_16330 [Arsenophonus apicola]
MLPLNTKTGQRAGGESRHPAATTMLGVLFYESQKNNERIERYANAYQFQQEVLKRLPAKIQKQFEEEATKLLNE